MDFDTAPHIPSDTSAIHIQMLGFTSFAVAGPGNIGSFIVEELLKLKADGKLSEVRVLTRSPPYSHYDFASKGAQIVTVDYSSPASLIPALSGVEIVISAIGYAAFALQESLAKAAKATNVQLFVPSEFGFAAQGRREVEIPAPFKPKEDLRSKLFEIGLPYAIFYTGLFPDYVLTNESFAKLFGIDLARGKVVLGGSGDGLVSFTGRADVARFLGYVLTSLPRSELLWTIFRVEGERTSFNDIFRDCQALTGRTLNLSYRSRQELEEAVKENPNDLFSTILLQTDVGFGVVGEPEVLSNDSWPEWRPSKVIDFLSGTIKA